MIRQKVSFVATRTCKEAGDRAVQDQNRENSLFQGVQDSREEGRCQFSREEEMKRIYLDSNILISYFSTGRAEETKNILVSQALAVFA